MGSLFSLIKELSILSIQGKDQQIDALCFDSRQAKIGSLFFAIPGTQVDGHQFLDQVYAQGCKSWLVQDFPANIPADVTCVQVTDSNAALAEVSSVFYEHPSSKLNLIGITGTNGKTTSVTLLFELFKKLGYRCGLISTVQNMIQDRVILSTHTTPDALNLNKLLAEMLSNGCSHVFMEVSSHSVVQKRIYGLCFKGAIFSNISRDHLDFHETFD